jgi:hypothetical protein
MAFRIDDDENRIQDIQDQIDQLEIQTFSPEVVARNESTRNTGIETGDSAALNPYPQWIPIRDFGTLGNLTLEILLNRVDSHVAKMTLNGDTDFAFSIPPGANKMMKFILDVTIDAIGGYVINLPGNLEPGTITIDNTANARTILKIQTTDGGVTYQAQDILAPGGGVTEFADDVFRVIGNVDPTKKLAFEVDGFTTGTTRVITPPNADALLASLNLDQTFTGVNTFENHTIFGSTGPHADSGFLRFANDVIFASARTGADDGNTELKFTTQDELDLTNSNNSTVGLLLRAQHAVDPDNLFLISQTPGSTGDAFLTAPNNLAILTNLVTTNVLFSPIKALFGTDIALNTNELFLDADEDSGIVSTIDDTVQIFTNNIVRFAVQNTLTTIGTDVDMSTFDIFNIDRLRLISDSGTPVSSGDPSIFLDGTSNMVHNIADQKQFFWTMDSKTRMQLDQSGVNNDTILTVETDASDAAAIPFLDIFRDDPTPQTGLGTDSEIANLQFIATHAATNGGASVGSNVYSKIVSIYESVITGREASSLNFFTSFDTGATTQLKSFLGLNNSNSNEIEAFVDLNLNNNNINTVTDLIGRDDGTPFRIIFDGLEDSDTFISSNTSDADRIDFDANGVNSFTVTFDSGSSMGQVGIPLGSNAFFSMLDHFMLWNQITEPLDSLVGNSQGNVFFDNSTDPPILKIKKKDSVGAVSVVSLEGAGASQTPITQDIDYGGFDIKDISNIEFRISSTGPPTASTPAIFHQADSLVFNTPSGDNMDFRENGVNFLVMDALSAIFSTGTFQVDSSTINLGTNSSDNVHILGLINADILSSVAGQNIGGVGNEFVSLFLGGSVFFGDTATQKINADSAGMNFDVPSGDEFDFRINGTTAIKILSDGTLDMSNEDIDNLGDLIFGTSTQFIGADAGGIDYRVPTSDVHEFFVNNISELRISGGITTIDSVTFTVNSTSINLGNSTSDLIIPVARFAADLDPNVTNSRDIGDASLRWREIFSNNVLNVSFSEFKKDIVSLDDKNCMDVCQALDTIEYKWNDKAFISDESEEDEISKNRKYVGFNADALRTMLPNAVKDDMIYPNAVTGILLGSVRHLESRITELENQVADLKKE